MDIRRVVVAICLILAGLLYSAWVAEFFLDTGLDPTTSFLSELDARDQPYREFFSTADVVTGSLMVFAAILGFLATPRRRLVVTGWVASGIFGIATIADAKLPLECVAADDPSCPIEPSGLFPQLHHLHALTSTIAVFAIFTVMVAFTLAAFPLRGLSPSSDARCRGAGCHDPGNGVAVDRRQSARSVRSRHRATDSSGRDVGVSGGAGMCA